jgi:hypothetical protein
MPETTLTLLGFAVCLDGIPGVLHDQALARLQQRDVIGFLIKADNQHGLSLVARNAGLLTSLGGIRNRLAPCPHQPSPQQFSLAARDAA